MILDTARVLTARFAGTAPPPPATLGPGLNPDTTLTGLMITGDYSMQNIKQILVGLGILLDGQYRENIQPAGVYNFIEKYSI